MDGFLFTYDLNNEGRNYKKSSDDLRIGIRGLPSVVAVTPLTDSTYLLVLRRFGTIDDLEADICALLNGDDEYVLAEVTNCRVRSKRFDPKSEYDKYIADMLTIVDRKPETTAGAF